MSNTNLYELLGRPVCLLDFETTGLVAGTDRVIEVSAIRQDADGRHTMNVIVKPDPVPVVSKFNLEHGITQEMVEAGEPSLLVFHQLRTLVDGAVIAGHNVPFDIGFLDAECDHHSLQLWQGDFICTRALATFLDMGTWDVNTRGRRYRAFRLENICKALGLPLEGAHRAENDLDATEQALLKLWPLAVKQNHPTLNAMVRPEWVQRQINTGRREPEYTPPRAVVYLVA